MDEKTIAMHERDCDKCCGSGKVLDTGINELARRWRQKLGLTARTLSALLNIPYSSYCKFERGGVVFGEARLRLILRMLTIKQEENK